MTAAGHRVRLEPLGEEIDCGPDETVLEAAFRQGYNLAYGCREGQCSACKCHLLDGEADLKPYSTFALSDAERENGYALLCRALPESDLVVELLHYDPDNYRLEHAIRDGSGTVESVTELTHDIAGLTLRVDEDFGWLPGQYIDLHVPDGDGARRSFSIANLPADGRVELMIKRYPGGRLSGMLGESIRAGTRLRFTGPYGSFHLRRSERPILMIAGGSGMAPVLALLRQLAAEGSERPVRFFYGAREERDLFALEEIRGLGLADFQFTPVTGRFVHEAVTVPEDPDVYMCGPVAMIEACEEVLAAAGVDPAQIFTDRFTTAADAAAPGTGETAPGTGDTAPGTGETTPGTGETAPGTGETAATAAGGTAQPTSEREFAWFAPAGRRPTLYEDVTIDTQPSIHRHLTRGWPVSFADGRGTWNDASTALCCEDWFAFRDPGRQWERTFYQRAAAVEQQLEDALASAGEQGLIDDISPRWRELLAESLQVCAFVEHGLWFALATSARDCLSDSVATCVCLQAAHKQRSAQAIVLHAMDLERHLGRELPIEAARRAFLEAEAWQPTRRYLERLAATADWGEVIIATNLCFEPLVGTLLRREFGIRAAAAHGDSVTPVLARAAIQEWEWTRAWTVALVQFLPSCNREVIGGWLEQWTPAALAAADALAPQAVPRVRQYAEAVIGEALAEPDVGPARPAAPNPAPPSAAAGGPAPPAPASGDHVGIVMAKSAEGDAVARFFSGRAEVIEQPAFWEIRALDRLAIAYDAVSEELGYPVDAYSIQHEMSTHYGRMVATDDALMLFSDPTEAMEHLMAADD